LNVREWYNFDGMRHVSYMTVDVCFVFHWRWVVFQTAIKRVFVLVAETPLKKKKAAAAHKYKKEPTFYI